MKPSCSDIKYHLGALRQDSFLASTAPGKCMLHHAPWYRSPNIMESCIHLVL
jgi:hypothetical protein